MRVDKMVFRIISGEHWIILFEDLDFADDLALMSHTKHQMQSKTHTLDEISKSIGLNIHAGKSKILRETQ